MEQLQLQFRRDLNPLLKGLELITASIGPNGELLLLIASPDAASNSRARTKTSGASFAKSRSHQYDAVAIAVSQDVSSTTLTSISIAHPHFQKLGDQWLLVGVRCEIKRKQTPEQNAVLYDNSGKQHRSFVLGDGIADVQCTKDGMIWVSYIDEGVFGNYGWGVSGGPEPIGSAGLACFNSEGEKIWQYEPPEGLDSIVECYAMNVAQDVWAYYYTDFPLVQIANGKVIRSWETDFGGAHAIVIGNENILLFGGYRENKDKCRIASLNKRKLEMQIAEVLLPDGTALSGGKILGRHNILHVIHNNAWFSFELS